MRTAAEFMSAMGFIKAESSGNFRPYRSIKRSELVDAIGQMFLHTDKTNTVGFSDVLPGDPSYDFLAAGVESSIIQGYGDDTFGGELPATRQELLTMCANTLVAGNICSYPEAPESFIKFSDRDRIAGYAVNAVALAVQQRLIESGGRLEPEAEASRGFAALVLYRMYTQYFR